MTRFSMKISITKDSNCLCCLHDITTLSLREKASIDRCFLYYNENRSVAGVPSGFLLMSLILTAALHVIIVLG